MPEAEANGTQLYYELHGGGEPLALVHGAWVDSTAWRSVVPGLAENFRVLIYDRRGHSRSERPATQGSFDEDGDDLAALLEALELAPAHVVTNSGGGPPFRQLSPVPCEVRLLGPCDVRDAGSCLTPVAPALAQTAQHDSNVRRLRWDRARRLSPTGCLRVGARRLVGQRPRRRTLRNARAFRRGTSKGDRRSGRGRCRSSYRGRLGVPAERRVRRDRQPLQQ